MIQPPHFFEEAADEIEHERQWYRGRSHTAENLFLREVDHAIQAVVEAPNRRPKYLAGTRRYLFHTFPFSSVYFGEPGEVSIVALPPARQPPAHARHPARPAPQRQP